MIILFFFLFTVKQTAGRTAIVSFDAQFPRGRCPERFYQVGEECLYFSIDGKIFSWNRVQHLCERRVGEIVQYTSNPEQPNMKPTGGVRQLVINTPQKTEILGAMFREYYEQNWAVRLPFDYDTLKRCRDGQDDKWPEYCDGRPVSNATCFETVSNAQSVICLREVDCNQRYIRFACEFTLPGLLLIIKFDKRMNFIVILGSADITNSQFRHCTKGRGRSRLLPIWVWITIAVGSALLILIIVAAIIGFVSRSRKSPKPRQFIPVPRRQDQNGKRTICIEILVI